jgi:hypothetical protein
MVTTFVSNHQTACRRRFCLLRQALAQISMARTPRCAARGAQHSVFSVQRRLAQQDCLPSCAQLQGAAFLCRAIRCQAYHLQMISCRKRRCGRAATRSSSIRYPQSASWCVPAACICTTLQQAAVNSSASRVLQLPLRLLSLLRLLLRSSAVTMQVPNGYDGLKLRVKIGVPEPVSGQR